MQIKFENIIPYHNSQADAFEELVCQSLRRTETAQNKSWVRLDGSGGDGGVEAYWYKDDGGKVGVQAKYFTRSGDISWSQKKDSFTTALAVHQDLTEYRIFIACDLTGPTSRGGKPGTLHWDQTRSWMEDKAQQADRFALLVLREWKSDTYVRTTLHHDVTLNILSADGTTLAETALQGKDDLGGSALPQGAREKSEFGFKEKVETLFGNQQIKSALQ